MEIAIYVLNQLKNHIYCLGLKRVPNHFTTLLKMKKKNRTKRGFSDHSVMQAAGLVLVLLLDLSDFLQEKNCIGEKKRKGIRNLLEGKEIRIRSALQYIKTIC